jgi:hypothetical protein
VSVPELPGVLNADDIPWDRNSQLDPWDHVEAAMALDVGGETQRAEAAYDWLRRTQRADGSWASRYENAMVADATAETNHAAYLAVGCWHHFLCTRDEDFLARMWPALRTALDFVTGCQAAGGEIWWAAGDEVALLTGSSSIHQALRCGIAVAERVGEPQPDWELAADLLAHAIRGRPQVFADKSRYSMDWYYPVLGGALRGEGARTRIAQRWDEFVVPGRGARCVSDQPWVTGAETCELALAGGADHVDGGGGGAGRRRPARGPPAVGDLQDAGDRTSSRSEPQPVTSV